MSDAVSSGTTAVPSTHEDEKAGLSSLNGSSSSDSGGAALPSAPYHSNSSSLCTVESDNRTSGVRLNAGADEFNPSCGPKALMYYLNQNTEPDPIIVSSGPTQVNGGYKGKGKAPMKYSVESPLDSTSKVFYSTDPHPSKFVGTHFMKLEHIPISDIIGRDSAISKLFNEESLYDKLIDNKMDKSIDEKWSYYFCYDDMRVVPSLLAKAELLGNSRGWSVSLSGYSEYENAGKAAALPEPAQRVSFYAGQVFLDVSFRGSSAEYAGVFGNIAGLVRSFAASFGDLSGFESVEATHPNIRFRVEYFKISDAENIIDATADKPRTIDRLAIKAMELTENLSPGHPSTVFPNDFEEEAQYKWISPTGRTAFVADEHGNSIAVPGPYVVNKAMPWATQMPQFPTGYDRERFLSEPMPQTPFSGFYAPYTTARAGSMPRDATNGLAFAGNASTFGTHAEPQTVDTMKIAQGQDCRTTIMLRNIPNRMTCHELKHVLDQSSHGRYDFSYLRIDFKKGTNVGYAFVNFANPVDIIPFVSMWYGVPWQPHGKRQVELSYATVQGYDCLVEKFRNSAVMSEAPDYRPKLWYTVDTAPSPELIGQEAPFPPSNNASKRQRSHDNAGQIGLYTPNSGNHGRDRGRHSHFDRGTPAQLQEEAMFYGQATQAIKFAQPWY